MKVLTLDDTVAALNAGSVVALPTDTVYGVGASIRFPSAVAELFDLKRRPTSVALPVVAASSRAFDQFAPRWTAPARRLSDALWPGALTIIIEADETLAELVGSATSRVGFRVPDDALLVDVLKETGPLALTSANEHGAAPCVTAQDVLAAFAGRDALAGVLDGGRREAPVSTVIDFAGDDWVVVREGAITVEQLAEALA